MTNRRAPHEMEPGNNGDVFTTVAGAGTWVPAPSGGGTSLVPLTTVVGGAPGFVWDSNDELVMLEAAQ